MTTKQENSVMQISNLNFNAAETRHDGGTFLGFADFTFASEVSVEGLAPFVAKTFISGVGVFYTNAGKLILNFPIRESADGKKYDVAAPATAETRSWLTDVVARHPVVAERIAALSRPAASVAAPQIGVPTPNAEVSALAAQLAALTQLVAGLAAAAKPAAPSTEQQS